MAGELKIGDRVKVREDLVIDKKYGGLILWAGMYSHKGEEGKIVRVTHAGFYYLDSFPYGWSGEMLELVERNEMMKFQLGDKVRIKNELTIGAVYGTRLKITMRDYLQGLKGIIVAVDTEDDSCLVRYKDPNDDNSFLQSWLPFEMLTIKKEFNSLEASNESKNRV